MQSDDYLGPERRKLSLHCGDHVETQERVARIETMIEVHNQNLARMQEFGTAQAESLKSISICTTKLSKQLDAVADKMTAFEERWNRRSAEADVIVAEYRQAIIAINQRFEEGDKRMDTLEAIEANFEWFRTLVEKMRTKVVEGFLLTVVLAILLMITMQWNDIGSRLLKWVGK